MKLNGSRFLPGTREEVWAKLNDPEVLERCIPGCKSLEQHSPTELSAVVAVKIGPISAKFSGDVNLVDLNPPESYRIEGKGNGGIAGRASGGANVMLAEEDGEEGKGTRLTYEVDASVSGRIAQLGQRLIDATAAKLSGQFFDAFEAEFREPEAEDAEGADA
jgi:carbon monoxide dehydrogenase subunit G